MFPIRNKNEKLTTVHIWRNSKSKKSASQISHPSFSEIAVQSSFFRFFRGVLVQLHILPKHFFPVSDQYDWLFAHSMTFSKYLKNHVNFAKTLKMNLFVNRCEQNDRHRERDIFNEGFNGAQWTSLTAALQNFGKFSFSNFWEFVVFLKFWASWLSRKFLISRITRFQLFKFQSRDQIGVHDTFIYDILTSVFVPYFTDLSSGVQL